MGYFSNIVKDSRMTLATRINPAPLSPVPDTQLPGGPADTRSIHQVQFRSTFSDRSPIRPSRKSAPAAAAPQESRTLPDEIERSTQPKAKHVRVVDKIADARDNPAPDVESTVPKDPAENSEQHRASPVIQREAISASAPRSSANARSAVSRVRQLDLQSLPRPAVSKGQSRPAGSSRQSTGDAVSQSSRLRPPRATASMVSHQPAAPGQSIPQKPGESATIVPAAVHDVERLVTSAGQPNRTGDPTVPVEATLKGSVVEQGLSVSSMTAVPHGGNAQPAIVAHDDTPRVRIGQVNVTIEEPKMPTKSSSSSTRRDDLGSRTFLRSL